MTFKSIFGNPNPEQMTDDCEAAGVVNVFPEMTKALLPKHLVSVGHIINYEPEINYVVYTMLWFGILEHHCSWFPALPSSRDDLIQNENLQH